MEENVVLPLSGDLQVCRRYAERPETVALQHPLGCRVMQESLRLEPMQGKFSEGNRHGVADRSGCEATAVMLLAHPVADTCGLKSTAGDPVDSDTPNDLPVVEDDEWYRALSRVRIKCPFQGRPLSFYCEKVLVPEWLPGREERAVLPQYGREGRRVIHRYDPGDTHHAAARA